MPRGGARPGAGRPRTKLPEEPAHKAVVAEVRVDAAKYGLTPLEYMLKVMNNGEADPARRDRMAVAAAPYIHGKASDAAAGKKEQQADAAKTAGEGTGWGDDLAVARPN